MTLTCGVEGASVVAAAPSARAGIVFRTAARMVGLHPELEQQVQPYKSELKVPGRGITPMPTGRTETP